MENTPAFFFDIDGVVANVPHEDTWRLAAMNWGLVSGEFNFKKFYQENIAGIPGLKGSEKILESFGYFNRIGIDEPKKILEESKKFRDLKQFYLDGYINTGKFQLFKDISDIIVCAKERKNISLVAVSSSENAERILKKENFYDIFDIHALGSIKHRVSKKEYLYCFALGKLCENKQYDRIPLPIVFEDSDRAIEAVKKLDYFCVGIAREGLTTEEALLDAGANMAYNEESLRSKPSKEIINDILYSSGCN